MTPEQKEIHAKRGMDVRVQIYRYILNGVPVSKITVGFKKSEKEVMDIFRHISRLLYEYCFRRKRPMTIIDCIATAQRHRHELMPLLTRIDVDKGSGLGKVLHENLNSGVSQDIVMDLLHEMAV